MDLEKHSGWINLTSTRKKKKEMRNLLIIRETKFGFRHLFKRLQFQPIWAGSKKNAPVEMQSPSNHACFALQISMHFSSCPSRHPPNRGIWGPITILPRSHSVLPSLPEITAEGFVSLHWMSLYNSTIAHVIRLRKRCVKAIQIELLISYLTLMRSLLSTPWKTLGNKSIFVTLFFLLLLYFCNL